MRLLVTLATLLALALRCIGAASTPLNFDEGATLYFARLPWADLFGAPARLEPNPPLFYAIAHLAIAALGPAEWVLRLPSILAGTLCVPAAAAVAARVAGKPDAKTAAVIAAFLVATSAVGVVSSQDARAYATLTLALLLMLAALLAAIGAARSTARPAQPRWAWPCFIAAGTAALYLHHTAALLLLALGAAALATGPPGLRARLLAANLAIAALYLPWLPVTVSQVFGGAGMPTNAWMTVPTPAGLRYAMLNIDAQPYATGLEPWADLVFLACGAAGILRLRHDRPLFALAILLLAGVPAASWAISQVRPIMNGKTLLPLAPVFLVFAAAACASLRRAPFRRAHIPAAAGLILIQLWSCRIALTDRPDEAFPAVAAALRDRAAPGDRLLLARPELEILLDYYAWPRDRLALFAAPAPGTWYRASTAQPGLPQGNGPLWLLSRSPVSRAAVLLSLGDTPAPSFDQTFGRGRMRNLELSRYDR